MKLYTPGIILSVRILAFSRAAWERFGIIPTRILFVCLLGTIFNLNPAWSQESISNSKYQNTPADNLADVESDPQRGLKKRRPPSERYETPLPEYAPSEEDDIKVLPEVVLPPKAIKKLSTASAVFIKKIQLIGNTVFAPAFLENIIAPFENKTISAEKLNQLRHYFSQLYLDAGYVNSGVIIPDQKLAEGIIVFKIIEGQLTKIEVEGLNRLRLSYIQNFINSRVGTPLNLTDLSAAIKLLSKDPLIKQVNAKLLPGEKPGQSILRMHVKDKQAFYYAVNADNYLSPSIGAERLSLTVGHANLSGFGDNLNFELENTDGLDGGSISYGIPVTRNGSFLSVYADYRKYIVVEEPFDQIDIKSKSYSYGLSYSHRYIESLTENLLLSAAIEKRHNESTLLEQPFSFSLGAVDGEVDVSVLDISLTWENRMAAKVYSLRGSIRLGLDALGATKNDGDLPDGEFSLIKGQFQYAQRLPYWGSQLLFRSALQYSNDTLLSLEKFAVGGRYSVRGYRENQYVRDNGLIATLEWRIPIKINENNPRQLQLAPFYDFGMSWDKNEGLTRTQKQTIDSIGLALLWDPNRNFHIELHYGNALDDIKKPTDSDLQDDGFQFQINYKSNLE